MHAVGILFLVYTGKQANKKEHLHKFIFIITVIVQ